MDTTAADVFKSLSDVTRLKMVAFISRKKEVPCSESSPYFSYLSQPTLSHHYKTLIDSGVLTSRKVGTSVMYSVNKDLLKQVGIDIKIIKNLLP